MRLFIGYMPPKEREQVMIKRIVTRLIESGIFKIKELER